MKLVILLLLASCSAFGATAPYSLPNDTVSIGKPGNTSSDKKILFNKNAANNPAIRFKNSTSKIQDSEDGTNFYDIVNGNSVDATTIAYTSGQLGVVKAGITTPGVIFAFGGSTCPTNSIPANGASLLRAGTYANLFAAISTTWGSADGTHFNAPNLLNRYLRGAGAATDGNGGTTVALGAFQTQATAVNGLHDTGHSHTRNPSGTQEFILFNSGGGSGWSAGPNSSTATNTTTGSSTANLSGDSETRPLSYGVNFCVWY